MQWYSNVEISWLFLGNFGSTFVLSLFSVHRSRVSSLTYCAYLLNLLDFVYFYNWVTPLYTKDINKTATITKKILSVIRGRFEN